MKRIVLLTLFLAGAILLHAQSEVKADTLDVPPAAADAGSSLLPSTVKKMPVLLSCLPPSRAMADSCWTWAR